MFPNGLFIETTTRCNARCVMCPIGKFKRPKFIDYDSFCNLIDECEGYEITEISLTGYGEPLCDTYLEERIAYIRSKLPDTTITIFTNGYWMTPDRAKSVLQAGLTNCTFSFDSVNEETYETIRKGLKFKTVVANMRSFMQINEEMGKPCRVRVHAVIQESNKTEMGRIRSMWRSADEITFNVCDGRGKEDRTPAFASLATPGACPILDTTLNVMTDGTVVPCCQDYSGVLPLGNVFNDGIDAVWNGERFWEMRALHKTGQKRQIPLCAECKTTY